jgi:hypothetical protein
MDIQAWYKNFIETHDREVEARARREYEAQRAEERHQAEVTPLLRLFERRLGRTLSAAERDVLSSRVKTHGSEHIVDLVFDLSGPELATWLEH